LSISAAAETFVERRICPERKQAYEIYQQARYEWQSLTRHRMQDGLQQLTKATELDPLLIPAQVDFIHACVTQTLYGFMSPDVAASHVRRIVDSIPDLPQLAETILPALGWISFHVDRDLPAALEAFSLSAHLPHDPWTTRPRTFFALSRHRFDEALALLRAALQEDPFAPWLHGRLAWALHLAGQAAESVDQVRKSLTLFPGHDGVLIYGAMILSFNGYAASGVELSRELAQQRPYLDLASGIHAYALACAGREEEARILLERLQWMSRERYVMRSFAPAALLVLGDPEGALAELRAAAEQRCPWFFQMLADPRLQLLQGRPEFDSLKAVLARMEAEAADGLELESVD
jgi:tetratricopeptide (TPR) repeat protein